VGRARDRLCNSSCGKRTLVDSPKGLSSAKSLEDPTLSAVHGRNQFGRAVKRSVVILIGIPRFRLEFGLRFHVTPFSDVANINRAGSDLIVQFEDYTPSGEIGLLDEGIDRYLSISPHKRLPLS